MRIVAAPQNTGASRISGMMPQLAQIPGLTRRKWTYCRKDGNGW
jgi:hypothetical protein